MSTGTEATRRNDARLAMRITPDQDTLADRRVFRLDDAAWTELAAILDRPARPIPELAKLLNDSAPWDA